MSRRFLTGILSLLTLVNGCATHKPITNSDELVDKIAMTGQGDAAAQPDKPKHLPNSPPFGAIVKWTAIGAAVCLGIAAIIVVSMAKNPSDL